MKIRTVLASQFRHGLVSVRPEKPVMTLPAKFAEHSISSVLVIDAHEHLHGIVTDRLFLAAMAHHGHRFFDLKAADIMQSPAPFCRIDDSVDSAMRRMTLERIRHLVVMDDGHIAGLVSIGDLVKARISDAEMESKVLRELALGQIAAR